MNESQEKTVRDAKPLYCAPYIRQGKREAAFLTAFLMCSAAVPRELTGITANLRENNGITVTEFSELVHAMQTPEITQPRFTELRYQPDSETIYCGSKNVGKSYGDFVVENGSLISFIEHIQKRQISGGICRFTLYLPFLCLPE